MPLKWENIKRASVGKDAFFGGKQSAINAFPVQNLQISKRD